jgi:ribosomal subunit interface protein
MKIIIKTKNFELTPALENFVNEKIGMLKKFIYILKEESNMGKTLAEVFVELEKETMHHRKGEVFLAKALIQFPGKKIMVTSKADDLNKAIIEMRDNLKEEITEYKIKGKEAIRRMQRKSKQDIIF